MDFNGTRLIRAPRADVWERLNDPATLKACLPGCESYEAAQDGTYDAVILAALGPVKARFKGTAQIVNVDEGVSYRIEGSGTGGIAGHGKLGADVWLESSAEGTVLNFRADVQMAGKLAQLGSRLVGSVANKFVAEFFSRFEQTVSAEPDEPDNTTARNVSTGAKELAS
jgi:carbon monoxide dehydrogenase subunit G